MLVTELDLPELDWFDPSLRGPRLHSALKDLRSKHWLARGPFGWVVLDRDVTRELLLDATLAAPLRTLFELIGITDERWLDRRVNEALESTTGETHARLRRVVNPGFGPRRIEELLPAMRKRIESLWERLAAKRRFDFVTEYATKLPAMAIADLLGIPDEHARLERLSWQMTRMYDMADPTAAEGVVRATNETHEIVESLVEARRRNPGRDVISVLATVSAEGDRLTNDECATLIVEMIQGGTHTTAAQLGHAMRLFLEHPDQWELLARRPELAANAAEEILRFEPSAPFNLRQLHADRELRGVTFPAGSLLFVSIASANRDPGVFADPDRFDVAAERKEEHLTFALGRHYCLGASLARAEAEIGLRSLLGVLPDVTAAPGPVDYAEDMIFHGPSRLTLRLSA